jgi:hypothetical protein
MIEAGMGRLVLVVGCGFLMMAHRRCYGRCGKEMREEAAVSSEMVVMDGGDGHGGAPDGGLAKRHLGVVPELRWSGRCAAARLEEPLPAGGTQRWLRRRWS